MPKKRMSDGTSWPCQIDDHRVDSSRQGQKRTLFDVLIQHETGNQSKYVVAVQIARFMHREIRYEMNVNK
jgi:hypothetical protein